MRRLSGLPAVLRATLLSLKDGCRQAMLRRALRRLSRQAVRKIVIGAGATRYKGWTATNREVLDLLSVQDWCSNFRPDSLDAILAEHVWEHLSPADAITAARNCFRFLKPGGHLRVAVPDGNHPDPGYIESVRPGGSGAGSDDHKVLYTGDTLTAVFTAAGFEVSLREYFDDLGTFNCTEWDPADGMVRRSLRHDSRNADGRPHYTSIILDARKPPALLK